MTKSCSALHRTKPAFCPSCVKQPVHSRTRLRAFFPSSLESNLHGREQKVSSSVSRAVEGKIFSKAIPFFFILFSGCARPFARIDRKLLDQKQTPMEGGRRLGSFLTGATAAQRQIVREKWRVKSWKEAKIRGGGLKSVVGPTLDGRMWIDSRKDEKRRYAYLSWVTNFATTINTSNKRIGVKIAGVDEIAR